MKHRILSRFLPILAALSVACHGQSVDSAAGRGLILHDTGSLGWLSDSATGEIESLPVPEGAAIVNALQASHGTLFLHGTEKPTLHSILFRADPPFKDWQPIWTGEAFEIAVHPVDDRVALTTPKTLDNPNHGPVIERLGEEDGRRVAGPNATSRSILSWHPVGHTLTYGAHEWIYSIAGQGPDVQRLFEGRSPSWSPSGRRLAFLSGRSLWIFDRELGTKHKIYSRHIWQTEPTGPIFWHASEDYLAVNVPAGATGKSWKCLIIQRESQKAQAVYTGYLRCGPWMPE